MLQPTKDQKKRRKGRIKDIQDETGKKKADRYSSENDGSKSKSKSMMTPALGFLHKDSASSRSVKSGRSQLVDLVVEDDKAEEIERVRARKEGSPAWNEIPPKHFV